MRQAGAAQQAAVRNASSWSSLANAAGGIGGQKTKPVAKDSFQQFKKQAQEKEARMKQQEIKRRQMEQMDRERQRQEHEKRQLKEEEEALERARRAAMKTETQTLPPAAAALK